MMISVVVPCEPTQKCSSDHEIGVVVQRIVASRRFGADPDAKRLLAWSIRSRMSRTLSTFFESDYRAKREETRRSPSGESPPPGTTQCG
jgi:hypothetical protein